MASPRPAGGHVAPGPGACVAYRLPVVFGSLDGGGKMEVHMDWGHTGPDQREVRVWTQCGHEVALLDSGGRLVVDGAVSVDETRAEYPMLYARFADLVRRGRSEVDLAPLQMTLDALALGRRVALPRFEG